ncbi:Phospho-N-acetylmuramoyl-pentapeptide-transferase [Coriobacterium glomerans PW2]|uniref:Phospho-N-acetylmuramoyl-pentapeptide-transferase n=1 Tax=Coriobacterium glomerans (strain ATCC 49209 / DSM 20642 / JCM 10262 / PW2) TaxID=700015 RepID=F2NBR3_CORGP|nr:phospho-N-acetylmuramoyl-pentapeptide-transferase [Coriobacterium glomerans]AEB06872.1 Phospho-N-acetylmuramoyl-pentapeptide-transferase [Coriobacterium glomerans PW2]
MLGNPAYPTYQAFIALGVAACVAMVLMPLWIWLLRFEGIGQQVRADGPSRHLVKQGTPTMGGVVILAAIFISCLLVGHVSIRLALVLAATLATGLLGLIDDAISVTRGRSLGLTPHAKMISLTLICVLFCLAIVNWGGVTPTVRFLGGFEIDLGVLSSELSIGDRLISVPWLYLVFTWVLIAGFSNAVNLTDGLDGLAGGTSMIAMLVMAALAFLNGDPGLSVFSAACAGACLGFLWYNCYPASIFMGDTGSLSLGAAFACVAIATSTEIASLLIGALFVIEALSVIIQVISFKATGRRVFLMAPIHHHFEKLGWAETKVVIRFWLISAACGALGFALLFQLGL